MERIHRDNIPPSRNGELWVERLKASASKQFTILSRCMWGVWTHWDGSRSRPCLAEKSKCPGCAEQLPTRWKGYLHVIDHTRRGQAFLEVTPTAARCLLDQIGKGVTLRGVRISCKRTTANNGRLLVHVEGVASSTQGLADELDPDQTLRKIWGRRRGGEGWDAGLVTEENPITAVG